MPCPHNKSFREWEECDRCGFDYPKSELSKDFTGARVCKFCWDQKGPDELKLESMYFYSDLNSEDDLDLTL